MLLLSAVIGTIIGVGSEDFAEQALRRYHDRFVNVEFAECCFGLEFWHSNLCVGP